MKLWIASTKTVALSTIASALLGTPLLAGAQQVKIPQGSISYEEKPKVILPLVIC